MDHIHMEYLIRQAQMYCDMIDEDTRHYNALSYMGKLSEYDIQEREMNITYYNNKLYKIFDEYEKRYRNTPYI